MTEKQYAGCEKQICMTESEFNEVLAKEHEAGYREAARYVDEVNRLRRLLDGISAIADCR